MNGVAHDFCWSLKRKIFLFSCTQGVQSEQNVAHTYDAKSNGYGIAAFC